MIENWCCLLPQLGIAPDDNEVVVTLNLFPLTINHRRPWQIFFSVLTKNNCRRFSYIVSPLGRNNKKRLNSKAKTHDLYFFSRNSFFCKTSEMVRFENSFLLYKTIHNQMSLIIIKSTILSQSQDLSLNPFYICYNES